MNKELEWYERLRRQDCRVCRFRGQCGDISEQEGRCPANMGGEKWAKFERAIQQTT